MSQPTDPAESLNVEQLLHLHTLTKDVARLCQKQLRAYLDTMALLFRPRRMLGDAMGAPSGSPSAAPTAPSQSSATSIVRSPYGPSISGRSSASPSSPSPPRCSS